MPDWFIATLTALPLFLLVVIALGLPWALVVLPRQDWRDRPLVACLSLAFGPAWLTGWMFVLGTLGQNDDPNAGHTLNPMQSSISTHIGGQNLMRPELILPGLILIALAGMLLAWHKTRITYPTINTSAPLAIDEKVIIGFIIAATLGRWLIQAWLPFGSWDALWVYGFQSRIYTLSGYIPADIGYYPQFVPLQYAFGQIMTGGINDHAARAALPFLQIGSILAVYVLGSRLFNRRTGIIAAALWALYPHFGYWTRVADLEIPLTFGFTGAAAFFLMAWHHTDTHLRRRYALIAGLFLGIAMWTKPTAGAFILGVVLLFIVDFVRVGGDWSRWRPRFEVAFWAGLACIPLGAVWYLRNIIIGHDAIVFPPSYWQTRAMRSGAEFGWPLLALLILLAYLHFGPVKQRPNRDPTLFGLVFIALGVLPSIIEPARMGLWEWLAFAIGLLIIGLSLGIYALAYADDTNKAKLRKIGWAWLLPLPYFVTWFYSYSYHYRLSFAIVPLMLLPTALILAEWLQPQMMRAWAYSRRLIYAAGVIAVALPGVTISVYDAGLGWDWLWTIPPADDYSRAGLLGVVDTLEAQIALHDEPLVILAPGLQTLPFFFPEQRIDIMPLPRQIDDITAADYTYYIHSSPALEEYDRRGGDNPFQNQWLASVPRDNVTTYITEFHDPSFFYSVWALHPTDRFELPSVGVESESEVIFGDFVRYLGHTTNRQTFDNVVALDLIWEVLEPASEDYAIFIHLYKEDDPNTLWGVFDGPVRFWELTYYSTQLWQPEEFILDKRFMFIQNPENPPGDNYRVRIGFYNILSNERVPVTVDGQPAGDGYVLETVFTVP